MLQPYVYVSTGKSRDVSRLAPTGARTAVHYPEIGRSIEIQTDAFGRYHVVSMPAPGHAGPSFCIATGSLAEEESK